MGSNFSFDQNALQKLAAQGAAKIAAALQKAYDDLAVTHRGRSVEEIKPILKRKLDAVAGGNVGGTLLNESAAAMADSKPFTFRART